MDGFLAGLRDLTTQHGALLIFDEVMTGFRVHPGGAQNLYKVKPDLTTLGKVIGGGLPVGAYGGRKEIMEMIAPSGPVYQAGTFSGNPLAMSAGIATLKKLRDPSIWPGMEQIASSLTNGLRAAAENAGISIQSSRVGTMFSMFFTETPIADWSSVKTCDTDKFSDYFQKMLNRGIYLAPSQFEAGFISATHDENII
ncbi:MAG: aminotransferase class III-fold pyridoxal phosphate-dependent enzyme [Anaerolineae bacterium]|nr:aminotransferase class III-fold pyridoxal phosphate-dependent enzyme [Anaerolineae bacterium]